MIVEFLCFWIDTFFIIISCYLPHAGVIYTEKMFFIFLLFFFFTRLIFLMSIVCSHSFFNCPSETYWQKVRYKWGFDEDCSYDRNQSSSGW